MLMLILATQKQQNFSLNILSDEIAKNTPNGNGNKMAWLVTGQGSLGNIDIDIG